jgi:hypothetical protein
MKMWSSAIESAEEEAKWLKKTVLEKLEKYCEDRVRALQEEKDSDFGIGLSVHHLLNFDTQSRLYNPIRMKRQNPFRSYTRPEAESPYDNPGLLLTNLILTFPWVILPSQLELIPFPTLSS